MLHQGSICHDRTRRCELQKWYLEKKNVADRSTDMPMTKLILAPFRSLLRSPLVHFIVVVILILVLQAAPDDSDLGRIFTALDKLVSSTVDLVSGAFAVKSFTKAWL